METSTIIWIVVAVVVLLVIIAFLLYRTGRVDDLIARQIVNTLKEYNIRAEIREFHTKFGPRTVEMQGIDLYDGTSGEKLGHVDNVLATIRIEDMYALNLRRNVNLESLQITGLEAWVKFDAEGRSNFRNITLPPPAENQRINFSYSTARIELKNGVIHFADPAALPAGEAEVVVVIAELSTPATAEPETDSAYDMGARFRWDESRRLLAHVGGVPASQLLIDERENDWR